MSTAVAPATGRDPADLSLKHQQVWSLRCMVLRKLLVCGRWAGESDLAVRGMKPKPRARTLQMAAEMQCWLLEAGVETRVEAPPPAAELQDGLDDDGPGIGGCFGDDY